MSVQKISSNCSNDQKKLNFISEYNEIQFEKMEYPKSKNEQTYGLTKSFAFNLKFQTQF